MTGIDRQLSALTAEVRELKALLMQFVGQKPTHPVSAQEEIAGLKAQGISIREHLRAKAAADNKARRNKKK